ncbi:MAG TPA: VPLPA-CTERM sorting domain-containing protein [Chitinivibrionales bacterium]|nr:VPLPA-CTERM sorting domain-containing protein [Chitinivibrionales bacterium]
MKSSITNLGFIALLLGATWVAADVIQLTGVADGTTKNFSIYMDPSQLMSGPQLVNATVYTGLYDATDVTTGQSWETFCIDPIGDIKIGDSWASQLLTTTNLTGGTQGILSQPSYTQTNAVPINNTITAEKYAMIGYLADQYYYNTDASFNAADRSDLSLAFWEISRDYTGSRASMNLNNGNFQSVNSLSDQNFIGNLLDAAFSHRDDNTYSLAVFSPTQRPSQEFLAFRVPEPALFCMLLTGLCALGGLGIARRRKVA